MSTRVDEGCLVVTGATRGIGRGIVELAIDRGRTVVGVARDAERLRELEEEHGASFVGVAADLTRPVERAELVQRIEARVGHVPGELVHAAGIARYASALDVTGDALREHFELHVIAGFELARDLSLIWIERGTRGSIVMLSSTLGTRPALYTLSYAAAKGAVESLVRGLALELAPYAIRVNAVAPGVVDTDMTRASRPDAVLSEEERLAMLAKLHPLGRIGVPMEVANTVLHALDASFMTGTTLTVDGGLLIG